MDMFGEGLGGGGEGFLWGGGGRVSAGGGWGVESVCMYVRGRVSCL